MNSWKVKFLNYHLVYVQNLGIKLTKDEEDFVTENCKILLK